MNVGFYLCLALVVWAADPAGRRAIVVGACLYHLGVYNERFFPGDRATTHAAEMLLWVAGLMFLHLLGDLHRRPT